jgi:hypothetical protein
MDEKTTALRDALNEFIAKNDIGDTTVYTQEEWAPRNEQYGRGASLVLLTEGILYEGLNYPDSGSYLRGLAKEFYAIVKKHGFWSEPAYGWMHVIYPDSEK